MWVPEVNSCQLTAQLQCFATLLPAILPTEITIVSSMLYSLLFALGPVYWLPWASPGQLAVVKLGIFGLVLLRLLTATVGRHPLPAAKVPLLIFLCFIVSILMSMLFRNGEGVPTLINFILPLAVLFLVMVCKPSEKESLLRGLAGAPLILSFIAVLIPLGAISSDFLWFSPISDELDGVSLAQTVTGFGGGRTGWSVGTCLLIAVSACNMVFAKTRVRSLIATIVFVILCASVFVPAGRSGMLSIFSIMLVLTCLGLRSKRLAKKSLTFIALAVVAGIVILQFSDVLRLNSLLAGDFKESSNGRFEGYSVAFDMLTSSLPNLLFGVGVGKSDLSMYGFEYSSVHNSILKLALVHGFVSCTLAISIFGWLITRLYVFRKYIITNYILLMALLILISASISSMFEPTVAFGNFHNTIILWFPMVWQLWKLGGSGVRVGVHSRGWVHTKGSRVIPALPSTFTASVTNLTYPLFKWVFYCLNGIHLMTINLDNEAQKQMVKEALQEWLDKQFALVGRWTVRGVCSMSFAVLVYLYLTQNGWTK